MRTPSGAPAGTDLQNELHMFKRHYPPLASLQDAAKVLREMTPETRRLFGTVETLVRLLLVISVSAASSERSFSALRRLKTWLRSTMSQKRLNHVAISHVHQEFLDNIDMNEVLSKFVSASDIRTNLFGAR